MTCQLRLHAGLAELGRAMHGTNSPHGHYQSDGFLKVLLVFHTPLAVWDYLHTPFFLLAWSLASKLAVNVLAIEVISQLFSSILVCLAADVSKNCT